MFPLNRLVCQNNACFEGVVDYKTGILTVCVALNCTFCHLSILSEKEWKQILKRYSGTSHSYKTLRVPGDNPLKEATDTGVNLHSIPNIKDCIYKVL